MLEHFAQGELISVWTTQPLDRALDYKAPEGGCFVGAFVEVPLGPRKVLGVVWGPGEGGYDLSKVRSVIRVLDAVPMRDAMREFLERAGLELDWRATRVMPDDFCWRFCDDGSLQLDFALGAGSYATALLAELVHYQEERNTGSDKGSE